MYPDARNAVFRRMRILSAVRLIPPDSLPVVYSPPTSLYHFGWCVRAQILRTLPYSIPQRPRVAIVVR